MTSSFRIDLIPSATHTRKPCGPARFGPMRDCMRAETRRSTQVMIPAVGAMKSRMIAAATPRMIPAPSRSVGRAPGTPRSRLDLGQGRCRRRRIPTADRRSWPLGITSAFERTFTPSKRVMTSPGLEPRLARGAPVAHARHDEPAGEAAPSAETSTPKNASARAPSLARASMHGAARRRRDGSRA